MVMVTIQPGLCPRTSLKDPVLGYPQYFYDEYDTFSYVSRIRMHSSLQGEGLNSYCKGHEENSLSRGLHIAFESEFIWYYMAVCGDLTICRSFTILFTLLQ